ncbi:MAG: carbohydrate kinase [Micropruina sp.]|nr:MAG: carbohydrate kinase [Micropruina sp.]
MSKSSPVLVLGEALIDVVDQAGEIAEHVGGSPANVAFGLGRLDHDVTLAAWFGQDERGERIAATCAAAGVKVAPGSDAAQHTPVAYATVDEAGRATYRFDLSWELPPLLEGAAVDHVHTGSIAAILEPGSSQVLNAVRRLREQATISYDPNARPTLMGAPDEARPRMEDLISLSDLVKASDEDIEWLYPGSAVIDVVRKWLDLGAAAVVVTRGPDGAWFAVGDAAELAEEPPAEVDVADTVGAGDSFMAGLVSGLLDAGLLGDADSRSRLAAASIEDVRPAIQRAIATSAITVSKAGAYGPTRDELGL